MSSLFLDLHPRKFFLETWQQIDAEAELERKQRSGYDWQPAIALVVGVLCLSAMEYFGGHRGFRTAAQYFGWSTDPNTRWYEMYSYMWWTGWRVFGYLLVPAAIVRGVFREKLRAYGLNTRQLRQHAPLYFLFFLVVAACIAIVGSRGEFLEYYPFYHHARRSWFDLLSWELMYASQFFALEFFFRGFWLQSCKASMGSQAIFAMVVPYCMIHYNKPLIEVVAAIPAGIVLGTLAMRTRSIMSGFLIHVAVALTMDLSSLWQQGAIPSRLFPH